MYSLRPISRPICTEQSSVQRQNYSRVKTNLNYDINYILHAIIQNPIQYFRHPLFFVVQRTNKQNKDKSANVYRGYSHYGKRKVKEKMNE